jgi:hypothetical protein
LEIRLPTYQLLVGGLAHPHKLTRWRVLIITQSRGKGGTLEESLGRRLWAAALTGIPFGVFKVGTGWYVYASINPVLGLAFVAWGIVDILLNIISVPLPGSVSYCLLSNIGRRIDVHTGRQNSEHILLAVDTLFTFVVVAGMIWFRHLSLLPAVLGRLWDISVVCNVVGVGAERLWRAIHQRRE